jgi:aspartate-semialdehyde dehydrogenase
MTKPLRLAIAGATGQVGRALLEQLAERHADLQYLHLLASSGSAGKRLEYGGRYLSVGNLEDFDFQEADVAVFATPPAVSAAQAERATRMGCKVLDFSGHFLTNMSVPLLQPGVTQPVAAPCYALPGAISAQLSPLLAAAVASDMLTSVDITALLPASLVGGGMVDELASQTAALLNGREPTMAILPSRLAFQIQTVGVRAQGSGHSALCQGAVLTLKRLFGLDLDVACRAFFVPVFHGLALGVTLAFNDVMDGGRVEEWLDEAGIVLVDARADGQSFPVLPPPGTIAERGGIHACLDRDVARSPEKIGLWLAADNVHLGAFMGVQSLEVLIKHHLY